MQSEFAFIHRLRERLQRSRVQPPDLLLGIGDDAAIVREHEGRELLVTTDLLVEDVDFKLDYAVPHWLGHKTLAVSLSDIAAMGGTPRFSLLTLAIPPHANTQDEFWQAFLDGYCALAEQHNVALIGGDLSATSDKLALDSIVLGECATGRAIRRSGARVGDGLYVTGALGASAAGLKLLLLGARVHAERDDAVQTALRTHLKPAARVGFGQQLGAHQLAHAMIDVSDGLAQDLAHLCAESHVAAILDFAAVPIAAEVALVTGDDETAFNLAIRGGEDFELLFTADRRDEAALFALGDACHLPVTRIGEIVALNNNFLALCRDGQLMPLPARGFDHFSAG